MFTCGVGIVYLLLGIAAFAPTYGSGPNTYDPGNQHVYFHFETLFGQLPMDYLLAAILIGIGLDGLWASLTFDRMVFVIALSCLAIGLMPSPVSDVFGLLPLFGWTGTLFLATAMFTFYPAFFEGPMPTSATQPVFHHR